MGQEINSDIVIIGAGIIGLSIALNLKKENPHLEIVVIEKEFHPGMHSSGRNSGVIHAGFYYAPDSLKARFCADGNRLLTEFCEMQKIPILKCGKVIVARDEEEIDRLKNLFERGIKNGVALEYLDARELSNFEPLARTSKKFIWSPTTSVSDPKMVITSIESQLRKSGVKFFYGSLAKLEDDNSIRIRKEVPVN